MSGIGLAIAKYILSQSHNILAVARSQDLLEQLQNEYPHQVQILAGDMGNLSLASKAVDKAIEHFGQVDSVIINHGIMDPVVRIEHCNPEDWSDLYHVNLFSAVAFVSRSFQPLMQRTY